MHMEYNIAAAAGMKKQMGEALGARGIFYDLRGDKQKALDYITRNLKIFTDISDVQGIAWAQHNLGNWYLGKHDYAEALEHYGQSLKTFEEIGDKKGASGTLAGLGKLYKEQNNREKESEACLRALQLAREINSFQDQSVACECLYGAYKAMGKGGLPVPSTGSV